MRYSQFDLFLLSLFLSSNEESIIDKVLLIEHNLVFHQKTIMIFLGVVTSLCLCCFDVFGFQCFRHRGYEEMIKEFLFFIQLLFRRWSCFCKQGFVFCCGVWGERGTGPLKSLERHLWMLGPLTGSIFLFGHRWNASLWLLVLFYMMLIGALLFSWVSFPGVFFYWTPLWFHFFLSESSISYYKKTSQMYVVRCRDKGIGVIEWK